MGERKNGKPLNKVKKAKMTNAEGALKRPAAAPIL